MLPRWLSALVLGLLLNGGAGAQGVLPVPPLNGHVIDQTATLSGTPQQTLDAKLAAFEASHGAQVVVLVVASTQPEDIASYANRVANVWKIGRKGIGDGLLLIIAKNDHKLRIEVAKTLEGAIPDLAAKQIIDGAITPRFKQGDYVGGINAGVDQILALIRGENLPVPATSTAPSDSSNDVFQWQNLLVFLFFGVMLGSRLARAFLGNKLGSLATGGLVGWLVQMATASLAVGVVAGIVAALFTLISSFGRRGHGGVITHWGSGAGSWSSGSSSGDSGGFSSGGGGDFGGGGASGDW
jgi:uncharacterized protein